MSRAEMVTTKEIRPDQLKGELGGLMYSRVRASFRRKALQKPLCSLR